MELFFYGFSALMIISSIMTISSLNPVHSVLWLIFAFCNGSGLMVLMGAEFIAMMLIIIYVGAVAVLFLFVVMMLDIKSTERKGIINPELVITLLISICLFIDLVIVTLLGTKTIMFVEKGKFSIDPNISNAHQIGGLLYTEFLLSFQLSAIILFVAMISSIALTMRHKKDVKRQNLAKQLNRNKDNSLLIAKFDGKKGLNNINYDD